MSISGAAVKLPNDTQLRKLMKASRQVSQCHRYGIYGSASIGGSL